MTDLFMLAQPSPPTMYSIWTGRNIVLWILINVSKAQQYINPSWFAAKEMSQKTSFSLLGYKGSCKSVPQVPQTSLSELVRNKTGIGNRAICSIYIWFCTYLSVLWAAGNFVIITPDMSTRLCWGIHWEPKTTPSIKYHNMISLSAEKGAGLYYSEQYCTFLLYYIVISSTTIPKLYRDLYIATGYPPYAILSTTNLLYQHPSSEL